MVQDNMILKVEAKISKKLTAQPFILLNRLHTFNGQLVPKKFWYSCGRFD